MKRTLASLLVLAAAVSTNTCAVTLWQLKAHPANSIVYYEPVKL